MDVKNPQQSLDHATLIPLVRQALGSERVDVLDWNVTSLGVGVGNPVSLGLYRVHGAGRDGATAVPWSLILKVAQSPANLGLTNLGEGDDRTHWNYWKREMLLYQSDLLHDLPEGLTVPRFFHALEQPGNVVWIWMEEVDTQAQGSKSLDQIGIAARHFGRFNGLYATRKQVPDLPFLARRFVHGWLATFTPFVLNLIEHLEQTGSNAYPRLGDFFPGGRDHPLRRAWRSPDPILAALDRLPQTLCHHDACAPNFFVNTKSEDNACTTAIDWALAGLGPIGAELAMLVFSGRAARGSVEPAQVEQQLGQAYLDGLYDVGWQGDPALVRFGFAAWTLYRTGLYFAYVMSEAFDEASKSPSTAPDSIEAIYESRRPGLAWLAGLAEEVWRHPWVRTHSI